MFRPSIQKTRVLVVIAIINIFIYYFVSSSIVTDKASDYDLKIKSANKMKNALDEMKFYTMPKSTKILGSYPRNK